MKRKKLIICMSMQKYAERIVDFITRQEKSEFDVRLYTSPEIMVEKEKNKKVNIMLLCEDYYGKIETSIVNEAAGTLRIMGCLCTDKLCVISDDENRFFANAKNIYKYQSVNDIYFSLITVSIDEAINPDDYISRRHAEIIGVFSPVKRTFKTTYAYILAEEMSEQHKTIYINLEGCSGLDKLLYLDGAFTLMDIIYSFMVNRRTFPTYLSQHLERRGGLYIICPCESVEEIQSVEVKTWIEFLSFISEKCDYERIVIDIGDHVSGIMDILDLCDVIHMPVREERISKLKHDNFMSAIEKYWDFENLEKRIEAFVIPYYEDARNQLEDMKESEMTEYVRLKIAAME